MNEIKKTITKSELSFKIFGKIYKVFEKYNIKIIKKR